MQTVYQSKHHAADGTTKVRGSRRKKWAVLAGLTGVLATGGVAYAAVQLYGFGQYRINAATTHNVTVDNNSQQGTAALLPGNTVGVKFSVKNPNNYPVTVTGALAQDSSLATIPNSAACHSSIHLVGTAYVGTYPGAGGGAATLQPVAAPVIIPAGSNRTVTVPAAVKQDAASTATCGVRVNFAVLISTTPAV